MKVSHFFSVVITVMIANQSAFSGSRLINGKPVEPGTFKEVVQIAPQGAPCTATIIGPRVIATAAHCASTGATATFSVDGKQYSAVITRSGLYPGRDHDIAIGVTDTPITGVDPVSVKGIAKVGSDMTLLGYGCTNTDGTGGDDGILRVGVTPIVGFSDFDIVSRKASGAVLCFGDSGGPAYLMESGKKSLIGVNSKGNVTDTNYSVRLDIPESQTFLKSMASEKNIDICGINSDCSVSPPPPPPPKPTCTITATPSSIKLGETLELSLITQGEVTSALLDNETVTFPTAKKTIKPSLIGVFTARVSITGPGGSNSCDATYQVKDDGPPPPPDKPSCTLSAIPNNIKLGESLTLEINTVGNVTSAAIEGTSVSFPMGKKIITPLQKGNFSASATVAGPGGTDSCWTNYQVNDGVAPPETPNFAVVPVYCGSNILTETKVSRVCLSIIKRDDKLPNLRLDQVLLVVYADTTREVLPIVHRAPRPKSPSDIQTKEDLVFYANGIVAAQNFSVLDTRTGIVTKEPTRRGGPEIPVAIEGRTAKGMYFLVDKLKNEGP